MELIKLTKVVIMARQSLMHKSLLNFKAVQYILYFSPVHKRLSPEIYTIVFIMFLDDLSLQTINKENCPGNTVQCKKKKKK